MTPLTPDDFLIASEVYKATMEYAMRNKPNEDWEMPDDVYRVGAELYLRNAQEQAPVYTMPASTESTTSETSDSSSEESSTSSVSSEVPASSTETPASSSEEPASSEPAKPEESTPSSSAEPVEPPKENANQ
jgi:penicillin-binding protein 1A